MSYGNRRRFERSDPREGIIYNDKIRHPEVRLNNDDGSSEILPTRQALHMAEDQGMDLVVVTDKATPPVCKIIDVNKFMYERKQRDKEAAKKARASVVEQKEIRMGLNIDQNDINIKAKNIKKMLEKNCKVTLTVTLKGRERGKQDMAKALLTQFAEVLEVELEPFSMGGNRVSAKIK